MSRGADIINTHYTIKAFLTEVQRALITVAHEQVLNVLIQLLQLNTNLLLLSLGTIKALLTEVRRNFITFAHEKDLIVLFQFL